MVGVALLIVARQRFTMEMDVSYYRPSTELTGRVRGVSIYYVKILLWRPGATHPRTVGTVARLRSRLAETHAEKKPQLPWARQHSDNAITDFVAMVYAEVAVLQGYIWMGFLLRTFLAT